jgi:hypothetical protein
MVAWTRARPPTLLGQSRLKIGRKAIKKPSVAPSSRGPFTQNWLCLRASLRAEETPDLSRRFRSAHPERRGERAGGVDPPCNVPAAVRPCPRIRMPGSRRKPRCSITIANRLPVPGNRWSSLKNSYEKASLTNRSNAGPCSERNESQRARSQSSTWSFTPSSTTSWVTPANLRSRSGMRMRP